MSLPDVSSFVTPETVVSHFYIKDGDIVADYGSGSGAFLPFLSKRTPAGRVYACEIQKALVETIGYYARSQGLTNIYPLWCDLEEDHGIPIQDSSVDVGVLANTLFLIEDKQTAIIEMARTLRSGGRLLLIDWSESFGGLGPTAAHVVSQTEAAALFESNGFVLEQVFPAGAHHYGLAFRKI
jgi:ubiquinone/menaquinone biosynthesis C-methylase UbiE